MTDPGSAVHRAFVGVDLGTQSVRAIVIADDGAQLAAASRPLTSNRDGVRHEQDPAQWWSATCAVLREATGLVGTGHRIDAVAVSATSGTVVVVDDRHRPVSMGIMYDDARGADHVERVNEVGAAVWSRLGYRMQGSWALPTMLALQQSGVLTGSRTIAHQPDVITAHLAGHRLPSDGSHALKTGIDLDSLLWPTAVFDDLGVPAEALPDVVASGTVIGTVDATASEETGLPTGCAIVAGMTDGCAAQIAAGALAAGDWNSVLGTTLVIKGASRDRRTDPTGAVYAHRAPFDAGWFPGGASSTGAGAVSHWLPGTDPGSLTAREISTDAPVSYPLVGVGERFPFVAPSARAFFGDSDLAPEDPATRFSAIARGVAFLERLSYDLLDLTGYDTDGTVSLTGGGSRNPRWNQLRSDTLRRPVLVPGHGEGAIGMAILAAAAIDDATPGRMRLAAAASRLLPAATRLEPRPASSDGYRVFLDSLKRRGWLGRDLHAHAMERAGT